MKITAHKGWPARDYFAVDAASASFLKAMKRSPFHAEHRRLNPDEPTAAMKFGTAWHTAFFEPQRFAAEYVAIPEGLDRRSKEGKALFAEVEASGRVPLSAAEDELLAAMLASAQRHPMTARLLALDHDVELSVFGEIYGVPVKARPDFLAYPCQEFPNGLILDGKTTTNASPVEFPRAAWNLDYHIQAALYTTLVQGLLGTAHPPVFAWLAAEKDAPHCCAYYTAGENLIEHGRRELRELLALYAQCRSTGVWPGYPETMDQLVLPAWAERIITGGDDGEDVESIGYAA